MKGFLLAVLSLSLAALPAAAQDSFGSQGQQPGQTQNQNPGQASPGYGAFGQNPQPQQPAGDSTLDQLMQMERQDYGVPATAQLHNGPMHGPTPVSIPGGQVITTKGLVALVQGKQAPYLLFDVLGGPEILPGAQNAIAAHQAGSFNDQNQTQFGAYLEQVTRGSKDMPLVFYCLSTQCWMSYNASLRAINLGYRNVLWYRGGVEAWKMAGLPTMDPRTGQQVQPAQQAPGAAAGGWQGQQWPQNGQNQGQYQGQ